MNQIIVESLSELRANAMDVQDFSWDPNITSLRKRTRDLEQSRTPDQTLQALERGFTETGGFIASVLLSTRGLPQGHYRVVYMHLRNDTQRDVLSPANEPHGPVHAGGIVAAITARPEPQLIQNVDWSRDPFLNETLQDYTSVIALPLFAERLPSNWSLHLKRAPERFTVSDLEDTIERTALAGALLENQLLAAELDRANRQIDCEARQVGELQRALLPASLPRIAGLEIAARYEPSGRAGGDLYDFVPLDEHHNGQPDTPARWCVFIGDTAGHGLGAAVVISIVQAVLHAHPARIARPASLLMHANRQLCAKRLGGFVTAFLGIYEPALRRLTYAKAGHPPPLLRRSSDRSIVALDDVGSYPLGIEESETFKEATVQLEPGDTVLLYTDGITEARGSDNGLFDRDRLVRVFRDGGERPAELIQRLSRAVRVYEHGQASRDDQTLVAARVL